MISHLKALCEKLLSRPRARRMTQEEEIQRRANYVMRCTCGAKATWCVPGFNQHGQFVKALVRCDDHVGEITAGKMRIVAQATQSEGRL